MKFKYGKWIIYTFIIGSKTLIVSSTKKYVIVTRRIIDIVSSFCLLFVNASKDRHCPSSFTKFGRTIGLGGSFGRP